MVNSEGWRHKSCNAEKAKQRVMLEPREAKTAEKIKGRNSRGLGRTGEHILHLVSFLGRPPMGRRAPHGFPACTWC